ncbi:hypothetical protein, partial [Pseudomonas aeruginosa]|uniref:hypothetical protein n=2 Tax=Pseudomonas aeruginosa TaxID=287 RepID=UPI00128BA6FB
MLSPHPTALRARSYVRRQPPPVDCPLKRSGETSMAESAFSERIVQNLLDTDFYKLTMMQAVL